jgi:hypothetical protein
MKKPKKVKKKMSKTNIPQISKKAKSEVDRILKSNMSRLDLTEESDFPFVKSFLYSLIKEQEDVEIKTDVEETSEDQPKNPEDFTPEANKEDFQKSLEPETNPSQFDVEGVSPELTVQNVEKIVEWSKKLDDFAMFLNSPEEDNLHKILADNDRAGSLLRGITRKASDSITRIAGEIEKLKEILNTYINTAPKKLRDTEQLKMGS